nr:hypothetical protein RchiOBHm_Chr7g0222661 [Ipomoea batatas]
MRCRQWAEGRGQCSAAVVGGYRDAAVVAEEMLRWRRKVYGGGQRWAAVDGGGSQTKRDGRGDTSLSTATSILSQDDAGDPKRSARCSMLISVGANVYLKYFRATNGPIPTATIS